MPLHDPPSNRELLIQFRTDRSEWLAQYLSNEGLLDYDDGWYLTDAGRAEMENGE
jgi:hypothetical protein